jgi:hypothetical protein
MRRLKFISVVTFVLLLALASVMRLPFIDGIV